MSYRVITVNVHIRTQVSIKQVNMDISDMEQKDQTHVVGIIGDDRADDKSHQIPSSHRPVPSEGVIHQIQSSPVTRVLLHGVSIVALTMDKKERLCLAQISNTLLKDYSYNEIHNRRVALGITCVQCTPVQLEILRRAGAMPASSRR